MPTPASALGSCFGVAAARYTTLLPATLQEESLLPSVVETQVRPPDRHRVPGCLRHAPPRAPLRFAPEHHARPPAAAAPRQVRASGKSWVNAKREDSRMPPSRSPNQAEPLRRPTTTPLDSASPRRLRARIGSDRYRNQNQSHRTRFKKSAQAVNPSSCDRSLRAALRSSGGMARCWRLQPLSCVGRGRLRSRAAS